MSVKGIVLLSMLIVIGLFSGCDSERPIVVEEEPLLEQPAVKNGRLDNALLDKEPESIMNVESDISSEEAEYGVFQKVIAEHGFPIELRYTEGMEIVWFKVYEDYAERERHHSMEDSAEQGKLTWQMMENTLIISGEWEESFTVDAERGIVTSQADAKEYRILVNNKDGDGQQWYVKRDSDAEGYTEIDGVRN